MTDGGRSRLALILTMSAIIAYGWMKTRGNFEDIETVVVVAAAVIGLWLWKPWKKHNPVEKSE